ncbi:MAG: PIN domain nuclease [Thermoprotei archaeon]|nr:MAG: PIN domain nuclease [Thermoprotei archaeon]
MERVVSDASVIVKWFIEEEYSDKALELRNKHINGEISIIAPELLYYEVLNALKYSRLFELEELKLAALSLSNYGIKLYSLKGRLAENTVEIAVERNITVYDAAYVALAINLDTVLYTADEKLIQKLGEKYENVVIHISKIP